MKNITKILFALASLLILESAIENNVFSAIAYSLSSVLMALVALILRQCQAAFDVSYFVRTKEEAPINYYLEYLSSWALVFLFACLACLAWHSG